MSPRRYVVRGRTSTRSPVWKCGCMLVPSVKTYVVEPPSVGGARKNHTDAQTASAIAPAASLLAGEGDRIGLVVGTKRPGTTGPAASLRRDRLRSDRDGAGADCSDRQIQCVGVRDRGRERAGDGERNGRRRTAVDPVRVDRISGAQ